MTEAVTTAPKYPPLLRRSQALQLVKEYNITEHMFRMLVPKGSAIRKRVTGGKDHYRRDMLIELCQAQ